MYIYILYPAGYSAEIQTYIHTYTYIHTCVYMLYHPGYSAEIGVRNHGSSLLRA